MTVYTADFTAEWKPSGSWDDITSHIESISGDLELSGNRSNALSFGDSSTMRCSVKTVNLTLQGTAYLDVPVRIEFDINSTAKVEFHGIITGRDRDQQSLTFSCEGFQHVIARTRVYTPVRFRRPAATQTTISSVEDPSDGAYQAGLINEALWRAGGRPADQDFDYPSATFYYNVPEYAILAPEWSWLAGENAWDECLKLAQAAGGQLLQGADGIVRYVQPLSYGDGSASYTFDENVYGDLTERGTSERTVTKVCCPYIPRVRQGMQQVVNDTTPRLVAAGATETIVIEAQNPLASLLLAAGKLPSDAIKATFLDGRVVSASDYTQSVALAGQRITISITNNTSTPFAINALTIQGEPIVAGEAGVVEVGSGSNALTIQDNAYIQSRAHAERLAAMTLAFHGTTLPLRTASGCVYDPNRSVGETVALTSSRWSLSAVPHVIVAIRHSNTGMQSEYDLVPVSGLPKSSEFFIISSTDYTGLSRKLGF